MSIASFVIAGILWVASFLPITVTAPLELLMRFLPTFDCFIKLALFHTLLDNGSKCHCLGILFLESDEKCCYYYVIVNFKILVFVVVQLVVIGGIVWNPPTSCA